MNTVQLVISNEVHDVTVKEFNGQRVVTLRDVDNLHRRPLGTANRTFRANSKYMIEGEDYFRRNTSEAIEELNVKAPNGLILLTESGYLLLVKTFTDSLAWSVQKQLINAYFKVKQSQKEESIPTSQEDIMIYALQSQKEMKAEIARLHQREKEQEQAIRKLSLVVDNEIILTKHQRSEIQQAVKQRQGQLNREGYVSAHFQGIFSTLKEHFGVPSYHDIARSDFEKSLKIISGWYPKKKEEVAQ